MLYKLLVQSKFNTSIIDSVEEFVVGMRYVFVRTTNETMSFKRSHILALKRMYNGKWVKVLMRRIKTRSRNDSTSVASDHT